MKKDYPAHARVFKAFCDENRLAILNSLRKGEHCACKLLEELEITQSTLSHHMKILCESGLVSARQDGKWTHYSLSQSGCAHAQDLVNSYSSAGTDRVPVSGKLCL